ncbi:hypothetical protein BASA50_001700 [Batrachochytrium salamandrivorans]|uniref:Prefoldin, alpha subunit n=1 Tax=Batrachochytrium salamandrivorans TaxID=1357716 RepID=A0ABQ8FND1_9FUNG|nr:hypothetical protein BASA62_002457 [Batrachochytrium salamandrivorans]KAH6574568.1 hypothetical protein BASA60_005475 [Batrachochytrium salamandrivorans]KAH6585348.1 hypothetical protein BASA61_006914 [Batrachochytrium salamandrivorans]KAH6601307.1 hypothetical protein BASA50_001700 [Batrachochytrium salamandrivorans]KAH9271825.1 hypothetical protein BASA83_005927 [Batrachochytrium salamandrivorans]
MPTQASISTQTTPQHHVTFAPLGPTKASQTSPEWFNYVRNPHQVDPYQTELYRQIQETEAKMAKLKESSRIPCNKFRILTDKMVQAESDIACITMRGGSPLKLSANDHFQLAALHRANYAYSVRRRAVEIVCTDIAEKYEKLRIKALTLWDKVRKYEHDLRHHPGHVHK